ncbi:methyltransferase domain-containing protein [filamentous cyanobacterium LEGE 11480]|uniref:Methyltransferase domain-containing protein n=1 Tax=Romeriopsis navalis LEGE 11480 TaxID=2777977 RepID=A0A928VHZ1_9CYAN|nr:class I SAM-dependent methyltransferase [Romeriopsis navalis]MBE9028680.1 methyltransferase domain-containing protein [Romeriopsis navalis LEGE 11480]
MADFQAVSSAVAELYNVYPFPPEPLLDEAPIGYNWRWDWNTAYSFCAGQKPRQQQIRILDAGCGTGCGTEYLVHLNPKAEVIGIDLSAGALEVAKERCDRSVGGRVQFQHLSLFDVDQVPGQFDLINCVGVLHHTPDPIRGIKALADKLAPGGIMHIFVYGELGRWEVNLMQQAIALLQGEKRGDYRDGVQIGRQVFANLPENNRLVLREKERWAMENTRDECFADMYVHPQEIDYNVNTLFELIDASGLEFVGFSNRQVWDLARLVGQSPEVMERAAQLTERQRYRLAEVLDPASFTHYEFFLSKGKLESPDWTDDTTLLQAIPVRSGCMEGWPSPTFFNFEYQLVKLSDAELEFVKATDGNTSQTVEQLLAATSIDLAAVRNLQELQVVLLTPGG